MAGFLTQSKVLWCFVILSLSACGFHLRGAFELPDELSSVYLDARSGSALFQDLKLILKTNGSVIVSDATKATSHIKIEKEETSQRVISVDGSGRAREYELKYMVLFSASTLSDSEHSKIKIDHKKLELIRDYVYDSEAVLGKSREKDILLRDMQRDASRLIMLQIQAAYRKNSGKSSEKTDNSSQ